jgi:thiol-disulfide isomerase/thioredoxin
MSEQLVPEFHESLHWCNAEKQTLQAHQGRVVVIIFWNASSSYCVNAIDSLRRLQSRFPVGLSILGIHVPKFDAETDHRTVTKAINRFRIPFPVANDTQWVTWQHYGLSQWPSMVLIDHQGELSDMVVGDDQQEGLESRVADLMKAASDVPAKSAAPIKFKSSELLTPLSFPSGLVATETHLYVADTGNNRILECNHNGRVLREFGNGHPDLNDGPAGDAAFNSPRGLCWIRDVLFIADTGNHAIRKINLLKGDVETVLGNGKPGVPREAVVKHAYENPLNQPWGLSGSNDKLYIGMAGAHQVWEYELGHSRLRLVAGKPEMGVADGPGRMAMFAQPSGLVLVQQSLYVVDSASSSIRAIQLTQNMVQTLVGQQLYEFGTQDGERREARMQFPQAVALDPSSPVLWIADTYNGLLRKLRLGGGGMTTQHLNRPLLQPSALAVSAGSLWIADAAQHEVLRFDLANESITRLPIGE